MSAPDLFQERPAEWRAPTPGEHVCTTCKGAANCGLGNAWYCRICAPVDFWPHTRSAR